MIEVRGFTSTGAIDATIDGSLLSVPDDHTNRHRQMIAEWEAEGNTIKPYSHPAPDLPAYATQKRWERETGGINVGGAVIATDDRSKVMISGARVAAQNDPNFSTQWKGADGSFVKIGRAHV